MINFVQEKNLLFAALMFYTRIPVPNSTENSEFILNKSRKYFPLIGVIVGILTALNYWFFVLFLPNSVAIILATISSVILTGAFHEDGFADTCDGLGGGWNKEQALAIMKDSSVGSYALTGIALLLLISRP